MNVNYTYWDIDTTDWDAVHYHYKPLFIPLDIKDPQDMQTAAQYFSRMTQGLIDGHYHVHFNSSLLVNWDLNPALARKQHGGNFRYPYSYLGIDTPYLDPGYITGKDPNAGYAAPLYAICGTIHQHILYFACNEFHLSHSYYSTRNNTITTALDYFFAELKSSSINGVIIDVRNNPGGDLGDLNFLIGKLIDKPLHFGYTRYKSGNGRLEYTPWMKAYVNPGSDKPLTAPVIALADNFSASLSEAVAMAIHTLPSGKVLGEQTWGATGPVIDDNTIINFGSFEIPRYLSATLSSAAFKYIDNNIYEGKGFPPDVQVPFNSAAINHGHDPQLEAAITLIPPP